MDTSPDAMPNSVKAPVQDFLHFYNKLNEGRSPSTTFFCKGQEYVGLKDVFVPSDQGFIGYVCVTDHLPLPDNNASVLEIGSGTGLLSCELFRKQTSNIKKIIATDINPEAVQNTKLNFEKHNIPGTVFVGDMFAAVPKDEKFDLIFWFCPCGLTSEDKELTNFERGFVDPGYKSLAQYMSESRNYLSANGKCVLIFNTGLGNVELLYKLSQQVDKKLEVIWKDTLDFPLLKTKVVLQMLEVKYS